MQDDLAPTTTPHHMPCATACLLVDISPHPQRSAKPSEKPRLRQIPSAEDLETDGGSVGPLRDDSLEHRESSHGQQEARGPVPLQQHQQVWLGPGASGKVESGDSGAW